MTGHGEAVEAREAGAFVAFMGIPGAGKSTVCAALAARLGATAFLEPEVWPEAVSERHISGALTALTWFRSMRVPNLYRAAAVRDSGGIALVDSYYDKVCAGYLNTPEMSWLLPPEDPWCDIAVRLARRDRELLPQADCVVLFDVDEPTWQRFLISRGRSLDEAFGLSQQFTSQAVIARAVETFGTETGVPVIRFRQRLDSPSKAAARLHDVLVDAGILPSLGPGLHGTGSAPVRR